METAVRECIDVRYSYQHISEIEEMGECWSIVIRTRAQKKCEEQAVIDSGSISIKESLTMCILIGDCLATQTPRNPHDRHCLELITRSCSSLRIQELYSIGVCGLLADTAAHMLQSQHCAMNPDVSCTRTSDDT